MVSDFNLEVDKPPPIVTEPIDQGTSFFHNPFQIPTSFCRKDDLEKETHVKYPRPGLGHSNGIVQVEITYIVLNQ